jgi:hypothetical protein
MSYSLEGFSSQHWLNQLKGIKPKMVNLGSPKTTTMAKTDVSLQKISCRDGDLPNTPIKTREPRGSRSLKVTYKKYVCV